MERDVLIERDAALAEHLARVTTPTLEFTEACKDAIAAVDAGEAEYRVLINGHKSSAAAVVEGLHLEPFLSNDDLD